MPIAPTGPLSLPISRLATLLSEATAFQSWVGAANATEALNSIHEVAADAPGRPFALIGRGSAAGSGQRISMGSSNFENAGRLRVTFEMNVTAGLSQPDVEYEFTNAIGAILQALEKASGAPENLQVTGWNEITSPQRSDPDEKGSGHPGGGDYHRATFSIAWKGEF